MLKISLLQFMLTVYSEHYDEFRLSFQPPGYYLPTTWIADCGEPYSEKIIHEAHTGRTQTLTFGWNKDLTKHTWHIDVISVTYNRKFIETGISLNRCDVFAVCDIWNIQVSNGFYLVEIGAGKPVNESFHYYQIKSENEELLRSRYSDNSNKKWLHIGSKVIKVTDSNLTLEESTESFGANINYIIIQRIKCGKITEQITLPQNTKIATTNYSIYYPSTVPITCDVGFRAESVNVKCNLNGEWLLDEFIECKKVDCGKIDESLLFPYDAYVYWQKYTYYNSTAIVICHSKDVQYIGELICKENAQWKWKHGFMQFRCPSFTPIANVRPSVFSQYLEWFIVAIICAGFTFIFVCLHLHSYLYNKLNKLFILY